MKIFASTRYASRLLLDMALHQDDSPLQASILAAHTGISIKFLEQIFIPLKKAGIVSTVRGVAGGYYLSKDLEKITMGDIVRLMQGNINLVACGRDPEVCDRSSECLTRDVWARLSKTIERELDSITLSDLVKNADNLTDKGSGSIDYLDGQACHPVQAGKDH